MSDDTQDAMRDLAPAYALDALDPAERAAFERAMATDPALAREVEAFRATAGLIGGAVRETPPPRLRARVLADAAARRPADVLPMRTRTPTRWPLALAASIALLAASVWQLTSARRTADALAARLSAAGDSLAAARAALAAREATLRAVLAPDVQLVRLAQEAPDAPVIQLFVDRSSRRLLLHASNLPTRRAGRVYQLWFVREGAAPIPSVTFNTDPGGTGLIEAIALPDGELPALAAVTEEPEGGSTAPTSAILLSGTFAR